MNEHEANWYTSSAPSLIRDYDCCPLH